MADGTAQTPASTEQSSMEEAQKGREFVLKLWELATAEETKPYFAGIKVVIENKKLFDATKLAMASKISPGAFAATITMVTLRKAMHFAGINTKSEASRCLVAVGKLGTSIGVAGVLAPTGFGAFVAVAVVAVESYNVGSQCFVHNKTVAHKLKF